MIATSHLIIGGAVGVATGAITQNPAIALAAGFISHLICDMLPHWDHPEGPREPGGDLVWTRGLYTFAYTDSIVGGLITLAIWGYLFDFSLASVFAWGAAGGYLPDFIDNVPFWKDRIRQMTLFKKFHAVHQWVHHIWMGRFPMPEYWKLGIATQLMVGIPALWYIFS